MQIDAPIQTVDLNAPLFATGTAKNMPDVNLSPAAQSRQPLALTFPMKL